jgi:quinol monooxygenase YgiN
MYVIVARIRTRPDAGDRYEALIRAVVDACARQECFVQFNIHRGGQDRSEFLLYEVWTDKSCYDSLRGKSFFQAYLRDRAALIDPRIERSGWTLLDSVHPISSFPIESTS